MAELLKNAYTEVSRHGREPVRLLVTDVNHRVRDFLSRELERDGYDVLFVNSGTEVLGVMDKQRSFDIVIIDPEVLYPYGHTLLDEILKRSPGIHIIFHAYEEFIGDVKSGFNIHIVEKYGSSIGSLQDKIRFCTRQR